jgi:hypothetical protein
MKELLSIKSSSEEEGKVSVCGFDNVRYDIHSLCTSKSVLV